MHEASAENYSGSIWKNHVLAACRTDAEYLANSKPPRVMDPPTSGHTGITVCHTDRKSRSDFVSSAGHLHDPRNSHLDQWH